MKPGYPEYYELIHTDAHRALVSEMQAVWSAHGVGVEITAPNGSARKSELAIRRWAALPDGAVCRLRDIYAGYTFEVARNLHDGAVAELARRAARD